MFTSRDGDIFIRGLVTGLIIGLITIVITLLLTACGTAGKQGRPGPTGKAGQNCTVVPNNEGSAIKCPDGSYTSVTNGKNGTNGAAGSNGSDGVDGTDGVDGAQGPQGEDGATGPQGPQGERGEPGEPAALPVGSTITTLDPCGKQSNYDEILFKTSDGRILAYFEHGNNRYLAELPNGSYVTTDGTGCRFTVHNGEVTAP